MLLGGAVASVNSDTEGLGAAPIKSITVDVASTSTNLSAATDYSYTLTFKVGDDAIAARLLPAPNIATWPPFCAHISDRELHFISDESYYTRLSRITRNKARTKSSPRHAKGPYQISLDSSRPEKRSIPFVLTSMGSFRRRVRDMRLRNSNSNYLIAQATAASPFGVAY